MVRRPLGKFIKNNWQWQNYLDESEQNQEVQEELNVIRNEYKEYSPEMINIINPCMESGHILVYAFDILMEIYKECGYSERNATLSILQTIYMV